MEGVLKVNSKKTSPELMSELPNFGKLDQEMKQKPCWYYALLIMSFHRLCGPETTSSDGHLSKTNLEQSTICNLQPWFDNILQLSPADTTVYILYA